MKKVLLQLLCALLAVSMLAGCAPKPTQSPSASASAAATPTVNPKPYDGVTLRVLSGGQPIDVITVKNRFNEFKELTGITIAMEELATDQVRNKQMVELAAKSSNLDLLKISPLNELKMYAKNGWAIDLKPFLVNDKEFDLADFYPSAIDTCSMDGKLYLVPEVAESQLLYYRKDIFEEKKIAYPKTMDELYTIAKQLTDKKNEFYGFVGRGKINVVISQFATYLRSFGGDYNTATKSLANTPEAIAAYKFYGKLLFECGPPGSINNSWPEAAAIFAQGKAAMFADSDAIYANVTDKDKSKVADKIGFGVMPAGPAGAKPFFSIVGGLGVSTFSKNKEAAVLFIKWADSKKMEVLKAKEVKNPGCRASAWSNPDAIGGWPKDMLSSMIESRRISVAGDRPTVINVSRARDIISVPIQEAILGKDPTAAANEAHKQFQALIDEENAELAKSK